MDGTPGIYAGHHRGDGKQLRRTGAKDDLGAALLSAAKNAVEDNIHDYLSELSHLTEGSFLEELDEYNVEVMYRRALQASIGYMLVARCGLDPSEYFEDDDFRDVLNFNTPEP